MPYSIRLPDGTLVNNIPDSVTPDEARAQLIQRYPELAPKRKEAGTIDELKRGTESTINAYRTGIASFLNSGDALNAAVEAGKARQQKIDERYGEGASLAGIMREFDENGIGAAAKRAITDIPRMVAANAPNMAPILAGGFGGARAGAGLGSLLGPAGATAGAVLGGIGGAMLAGAPQHMSGNVLEQAQVAEEQKLPLNIDKEAALLATAGQTALDVGGGAGILGKTLLKKVLGVATDDVLKTPAAKRALLDIAQGAARGAASEIPTEVAQQVLQRAQAGRDLTSPEAWAEYGEVAYQAGVVGGAFGGGSNAITRMKGAEPASAGPSAGEAPIDALKRAARAQQAPKQAPEQAEVRPVDMPVSHGAWAELEMRKRKLLKEPGGAKKHKQALDEIAAVQERMGVQLAQESLEGQQRRTPDERAAALAEESAFADMPQQELFDDKLYTPERAAEPETAPEAPGAAMPGQMELPLRPVPEQQPLFPEMGGAQPAPAAQPAPEAPLVMEPEQLQAMGLTPRSAIYRRLVGTPIGEPAQMQAVRDTILKYADSKYVKPEAIPAITNFLERMDAQIAHSDQAGRQVQIPEDAYQPVPTPRPAPTTQATPETIPEVMDAPPIGAVPEPKVRKKGEKRALPAPKQSVGRTPTPDAPAAVPTAAPADPAASLPGVGVVDERPAEPTVRADEPGMGVPDVPAGPDTGAARAGAVPALKSPAPEAAPGKSAAPEAGVSQDNAPAQSLAVIKKDIAVLEKLIECLG